MIHSKAAEHTAERPKYDALLEIVKKIRGYISWFGHIMLRARVTMPNTVPQGEVEGERSRGTEAQL